jgi:MtrB/PioB family decaheme-associated outer membrane protein
MRTTRPLIARRPICATIVAVVALSGVWTSGARVVAAEQERPDDPLGADAASPSPAPPTPGSEQGNGTAQTPSGVGEQAPPSPGSREDIGQAGTLYPPWSLRPTLQIDPRVQPNLGLRGLTTFHPIKDGPLLYPPFSPLTPDYRGEQTARPWALRVSTAFFAVDDERASSKLQEYRDLTDGFAAGLEAKYRRGNTAFSLVGRQLGRDDLDLRLDAVSAGRLQISALYDEIPHRFAFDAKSLYGGIGTSHLTIPDSIQAALQNSTSNANLAQRVGAFVSQQGVSIDEELRRKQAGGEVVLLATYPLVAKASFSTESRDGLRPYSGSFGFGDFVEIPWPVQYDTRDARVSLEWAKPESRLQANAAYRYSSFVNHMQSFLFDNPFRITDGASLMGTFNNGPIMGRMTVEPSNQYHEASGSFVLKDLPLRSTVTGLVSFGFMRQDEPLVPFSTNTVDILSSPTLPSFNATDPAGLPRATARAAMDTQTAHLRWTGGAIGALHLTGQYRFSRLDNQEEPFTTLMFVREDQDVRRPETPGGTYRTVLAGYSRHTFTGEAGYDLPLDSRVSLVYTFERMNRVFREVAWMNDHRLKVQFDTRRFGMLELKSWYQRTSRSTADYRFNQYNEVQGNPQGRPMLPYLRKFDEAPYHRNEAQIMATAYVTDATSLSVHVQYLSTDYIDSPAGILWDKRYSYGADFTYALTDRLNFFADAGLERVRSQQAARQWTPFSVSNPYLRETGLESNSNWTASPYDDYWSAGLGLDADLVQQRLRLNLQYNFSRSDGRHSYTSPLGVAANDVNAFEPTPFDDVDDIRWHTLDTELEYRHSERLSFSLGYHFEKYQIDDFSYRGFSYTPLYTTGVAVLMGGDLPPAYKTNVFFVRLKLGL